MQNITRRMRKLAPAIALSVEPQFRRARQGMLESVFLFEIFFQEKRGCCGGSSAAFRCATPGRVLPRGEYARADLVRTDRQRRRDRLVTIARGILKCAHQAEAETAVASTPFFRLVLEAGRHIRKP